MNSTREPPSLESMQSALFEILALGPESSAGGFRPEGIDTAPTLDDVKPSGLTSKLVAIVFCLPGSKYADEILKNLSYFNFRAATADVFLAGYGPDWPPALRPDQTPVAKIDETPWYFSHIAYLSLAAEVETKSTWKYGGGTDLLLFAARGNRRSETFELDFSTAMACNFEAMEGEGAIPSVQMFIDSMLRFSNEYLGEDPLGEYSNKLGLKQGKRFVIDVILSVLPEPVKKLYKNAKHMAVRDISKPK